MTLELLTSQQMTNADRLATEAGTPSLVLMENAGAAIARIACKTLKPQALVVVLCGPGNNGGDGFVVARLLHEAGHRVHLALTCARDNLSKDAAQMAARWSSPIDTFESPAVMEALSKADVIIDGIFGAGVTRAIDPDTPIAKVIRATNDASATVIAIDVPTGVNGTTGEADEVCVKANNTVTFFRKKPGHLLMPAREMCGVVSLADIGIPSSVIAKLNSTKFGPINVFENDVDFWRSHVKAPSMQDHKYHRGHTVCVSGPAHATGAVRLAAKAALRIGSGLVTVASPLESVATNAAHLTAIMIAPFEDNATYKNILADTRKTRA